MNIIKKNRLTLALLLALLVSLCFFCDACSAGNQQAVQKPSISFGEESDKTKALALDNATGKTITEVRVASSGQTNTTKLAVQGNQNKWEPDTKAVINIPEMQNNNVTTESGNVSLRPSCDITFTCDEGSSYTVHAFVINSTEDISDIKLNYSSADNLFYLTYRNNDSDINTLANEQKVVADAKAAADAAAAQKAAEDNAAKSSISTNNSSSSGSSSRSSSQSSGGTSGSGQSSNGCVDGGVRLR